MMHTMERYFTNGGNMELTDALAEGLLRTVMKNAVILHTDPANYEARASDVGGQSVPQRPDRLRHRQRRLYVPQTRARNGRYVRRDPRRGPRRPLAQLARYVYKDCLPRFVRFARNVMGVTTDGTDERSP